MYYIKEIYNPSRSLDPSINNKYNDRRGCFIDIGYRNMGIRFSKYDGEKIEGIKQFKADYDLSKGNKEEKKILIERSSLGIENDKFYSMADHMSMLEEDFVNCDYIVIEHQLDFVAKENTKVMNILVGIFMNMLKNKGRRPIIILLDARSKTVLLGAPKKLGKKEVKDWCYEKSLEILKENKGSLDSSLLEKLPLLPKTGKNKRDDHGDIICYCHIWWKIIYKDFIAKYSL